MENNRTTGVSFGGLLAIVLIVLKLCNVIDWSWIWVLGPFWIPAAVIMGVAFPIWLIVNRRRND